jgi:hypothetical protein
MEDREAAFVRLCALYVSVDQNIRENIRAAWPFARSWRLPNGSNLTFWRDQQFSPRERIVADLIALTLDPEIRQPDFRDELMNLAQTYHSAKVAGLDPDALFYEIAKLSDPTVGRWLSDFADRKPDDKSLQAFCMAQYTSEFGEIGIRRLP